MFGIDLKNTLHEALNNYVKAPFEQKANDLQADLNQKFADFKSDNQKFQRTLIAIALATFLVITISYTLQDIINHD